MGDGGQLAGHCLLTPRQARYAQHERGNSGNDENEERGDGQRRDLTAATRVTATLARTGCRCPGTARPRAPANEGRAALALTPWPAWPGLVEAVLVAEAAARRVLCARPVPPLGLAARCVAAWWRAAARRLHRGGGTAQRRCVRWGSRRATEEQRSSRAAQARARAPLGRAPRDPLLAGGSRRRAPAPRRSHAAKAQQSEQSAPPPPQRNVAAPPHIPRSSERLLVGVAGFFPDTIFQFKMQQVFTVGVVPIAPRIYTFSSMLL